MTPASRVFVALDVPGAAEARALAARAGRELSYKVGLELFAAAGPALVREIEGASIFLDLKLHDIPETVARAVRSAARSGASYLTVHALGGERMLAAAQNAAADAGIRLLAVTVLTSHDDAELARLRLPSSAELVPLLARTAIGAGISGFVCSPLEAGALRGVAGPDAFIVTPGIRATSGGDDQRRTATAAEAIRCGASAIVVGRPIRDAADPRAAALAIARDVEGAMKPRG
ncbi:MAG: orotidine-5'-phosphate decarboxylase [Acidobacteriota bacterium]